MTKKYKVTFVLPEKLQKEYRTKIINEGYSLRDKSRWVSDAITNLFQYKFYPDWVKYGDEFKGFDKTETIVVSENIKQSLNDAIVEVRQQYPSLEGVQSRIVRTAILQKIIQS